MTAHTVLGLHLSIRLEESFWFVQKGRKWHCSFLGVSGTNIGKHVLQSSYNYNYLFPPTTAVRGLNVERLND